jgi:hypothetical protein
MSLSIWYLYRSILGCTITYRMFQIYHTLERRSDLGEDTSRKFGRIWLKTDVLLSIKSFSYNAKYFSLKDPYCLNLCKQTTHARTLSIIFPRVLTSTAKWTFNIMVIGRLAQRQNILLLSQTPFFCHTKWTASL